MLLNPVLITNRTAASGTWSFNTPKLVSSILKQIIVKAATATTTFDFQIIDENNLEVYNTDTPATGVLRHELDLPLKGICTIKVLNSSADEVFSGKISLLEGGL